MALTHWETTTNFMGFHPIPRFRAYLGATSAWLGPYDAAQPYNRKALPWAPQANCLFIGQLFRRWIINY
jgi:hypothetical protein